MKRFILAGMCALAITACTQEMMSQTGSNSASETKSEATDQNKMAGDESKDTSMSFFITSKGPGNGGNLGGLAGADAHCQQLADATGSKGKTWKAYLSTSKENAKDRIGSGPWFNAKGTMIASNLDELHNAEANKINKENGLTESGDMVNGRGDSPNRHDILTGSTAEGTVTEGKTCEEWTSSASENVSGFVGHHDRVGLNDDPPSKSWNSSHASRGCSQSDLQGTGGDGLFYCFAKN